MMMREESMQIKFLAREGVPKARIAERLGVSRQTTRPEDLSGDPQWASLAVGRIG